MGNPYYIQPRNNPMDWANLGMKLYGIREHGKLEKGRQDIDKRRAALEERRTNEMYGGVDPTTGQPVKGVEREKVAIDQRQTDIASRRVDLLENTPEARFAKKMAGPPSVARLLTLKTKFDYFTPVVNEVLEGIGKGEIKTRQDVYDRMKPVEAMKLQDARENAEKKILSLIKQGKNEEAEMHSQMYNMLKPGFLEQFFGFPQAEQPKQGDIDYKAPTLQKPSYTTIKGYDAEGNAVVETTPKTPGTTMPSLIKSFSKPTDTAKKPPTASELRATAKDVAKAEETILSNTNSDAAQGQVDFFNQYANKPYVYVWNEGKPGSVFGKLWPDEKAGWKKLDLPKWQGEKVSAADIYQTASENNITIEDVLQKIGALK